MKTDGEAARIVSCFAFAFRWTVPTAMSKEPLGLIGKRNRLRAGTCRPCKSSPSRIGRLFPLACSDCRSA